MYKKQKPIKFIFMVLSYILFNFSSGCSKSVIKSENIQEQQKESRRKILSERHQAVTIELKIIKNKLYELNGQIYTFTTKEKYNRKMLNEPMEKNDNNKEKLDAAKIETKDLQNKYDALISEIKEIEQNLKESGYPIEIPKTPELNDNIIPAENK